jgi:antitoxin component of MazEF toxin-antitoxin module
MDVEISSHRTQKMGDALYILLPRWWTKQNDIQHGDELVLGKNSNGELCISKRGKYD